MAKRRFIRPIQKIGRGLSDRQATVAAITVCNQRISTGIQIINPKQCPNQVDLDLAQYFCNCNPPQVYDIIASRTGVRIGGTWGQSYDRVYTPVILNTVYEVAVNGGGAGVKGGGSARRGPDITNLSTRGGAVLSGFVEVSTATINNGDIIYSYENVARGGVMIGGSARRGPDIINISTRGGVIINGYADVSRDLAGGNSQIYVIYEAETCICPAAGVACGGTADVDSSAYTIQIECTDGTQFRQVGDWQPCGLSSNYSCGNDGYNGFGLTSYFDWSQIGTDGTVGGSLFDGTRELQSATLTIGADVYNAAGFFPSNPFGPEGLFFQLPDPTVWRLYGTQSIQVDVTIDGEVFTWYLSQTFDSCPVPQLDNNNPGTPYFEASIQSFLYNSEIDTTTVSLYINYPCYGDGGMNVTSLCWFAPDIGGCFCTDESLPINISTGGGQSFDFSFPGNRLGQFLGRNFLCIAFDQPLFCAWNWFFYVNIPSA